MTKKKTTRGSAARRGKRASEWTIVDLDLDVEAWRVKREIPKKKMAEMVGVTNSTYHNWLKGIAVATPNTQRRIKAILDSNGAAAMVPATARSAEYVANSNEVARTVGTIITAYVGADPGVTTDALIAAIREVRKALAA